MVAQKSLSAAQRESLGFIEQSGRELLALIETILDMAKIEAGRMMLVQSPVSLGFVVAETCGAGSLLAAGRRFEFEVDIADGFRVLSATRAASRRPSSALIWYSARSRRRGIGDRRFDLRVGRFRVAPAGDPRHAKSKRRTANAAPRRAARLLSPDPSAAARRRYGGLTFGLALARSLIDLHGGTLRVANTARRALRGDAPGGVCLPAVCHIGLILASRLHGPHREPRVAARVEDQRGARTKKSTPAREPDDKSESWPGANKATTPASIDSFVRARSTSTSGKSKHKANLRVFIEAARRRDEPLDHVLFCGPPGLGKTTLAYIIAQRDGRRSSHDLGSGRRAQGRARRACSPSCSPTTSSSSTRSIASAPAVEESLYPAMEDFKIDITTGEGPYAATYELPIPPFTLVGATTRTGLLTAPLLSRFGYIMRLDFYPRRIWRDRRPQRAHARGRRR